MAAVQFIVQDSHSTNSEISSLEKLIPDLMVSEGEQSCCSNGDSAVDVELSESTNLAVNISKTENDVSCFVPPDESLISAIVTQVEYYFSDANLPTDKFLLQQIARDKYSFVPLNVIASFKKMKKLTKDIRVIAYALQYSSKLEVSKNESRVRKKHCLQVSSDDLSLLRTVVAINIRQPTVESVNNQFSLYGPVVNVSIICCGEFVTASDLRRQVRKGLDSYGKAVTDIAIVEFENKDSASLACEKLRDTGDWRRGLHVSVMIPTHSKKSVNKSEDIDCSDLVTETNSVAGITSENTTYKGKNKQTRQSKSRSDDHSREDTAEYTRLSDRPVIDSGNRASSPNCIRPTAKVSPGGSPLLNCRGTVVKESLPQIEGNNDNLGNSQLGVSPWVQQRRLMASQIDSAITLLTAGDGGCGDGTLLIRKSTEQLTVIRQPKGPDGSKGFTLARM